ncbi:allergen Tha p 1-like [Bombyx mandarina]|uniref:Chemosensory protein 13 n=4 Tax=Bombyx TaxID=7090 RepID=Q8MMK8_BOMMO|nr:chemosensory protein 13 precursor [Bombyx mori]XP_028028263.1 allergen Tha p 1-like [Bombyx mandarina]AAM34275.1 chemosensory protein CSP2 [Bombyx mori]ABH88206.1 chemosensory protein 13 [Bombyx mori]CAJ01454.1 hypothetical protein [Bombyx mori]
MKLLLVFLGLFLAVLAQDKYEPIDDSFDASEVLSNERLLKSYTKCLLNQGPCTAELKKIKDKIPEALETHCAKCTDKQKQMAKQLAQGIKKTHPELWDEFITFYDPQGKYQTSFKDFLES